MIMTRVICLLFGFIFYTNERVVEFWSFNISVLLLGPLEVSGKGIGHVSWERYTSPYTFRGDEERVLTPTYIPRGEN